MNQLEAFEVEQLLIYESELFPPTIVYISKDVDKLITQLSNIIFSLEQAIISNPEWSRILRKDIKKIKQLRKKGIIYGKYISNKD